MSVDVNLHVVGSAVPAFQILARSVVGLAPSTSSLRLITSPGRLTIPGTAWDARIVSVPFTVRMRDKVVAVALDCTWTR